MRTHIRLALFFTLLCSACAQLSELLGTLPNKLPATSTTKIEMPPAPKDPDVQNFIHIRTFNGFLPQKFTLYLIEQDNDTRKVLTQVPEELPTNWTMVYVGRSPKRFLVKFPEGNYISDELSVNGFYTIVLANGTDGKLIGRTYTEKFPEFEKQALIRVTSTIPVNSLNNVRITYGTSTWDFKQLDQMTISMPSSVCEVDKETKDTLCASNFTITATDVVTQEKVTATISDKFAQYTFYSAYLTASRVLIRNDNATIPPKLTWSLNWVDRRDWGRNSTSAVNLINAHEFSQLFVEGRGVSKDVQDFVYKVNISYPKRRRAKMPIGELVNWKFRSEPRCLSAAANKTKVNSTHAFHVPICDNYTISDNYNFKFAPNSEFGGYTFIYSKQVGNFGGLVVLQNYNTKDYKKIFCVRFGHFSPPPIVGTIKLRMVFNVEDYEIEIPYGRVYEFYFSYSTFKYWIEARDSRDKNNTIKFHNTISFPEKHFGANIFTVGTEPDVQVVIDLWKNFSPIHPYPLEVRIGVGIGGIALAILIATLIYYCDSRKPTEQTKAGFTQLER